MSQTCLICFSVVGPSISHWVIGMCQMSQTRRVCFMVQIHIISLWALGMCRISQTCIVCFVVLRLSIFPSMLLGIRVRKIGVIQTNNLVAPFQIIVISKIFKKILVCIYSITSSFSISITIFPFNIEILPILSILRNSLIISSFSISTLVNSHFYFLILECFEILFFLWFEIGRVLFFSGSVVEQTKFKYATIWIVNKLVSAFV